MERERSRGLSSRASSEAGEVIHVDDAHHPSHHPDGWSHSPEHADAFDVDTDNDDEPILAADEVRPESAYLHPAVSPVARRGSTEPYELERFRSRTPSAPNSRPGSRPGSMHGAPLGLSRYSSRGEDYEDPHTALEDVEEYEPLFPDEEGKSGQALSTAERFKKRQESLKRRFPSQDIWEDTPDSLQLHASVSTPDLPQEEPRSTKFESSEAEAGRRKQTEGIDPHQVASKILESSGQAPSRPVRPNRTKQRFPSQDIWEDVPESQRLVATIDPEGETTSKPRIPPRPARTKHEAGPDSADSSSVPVRSQRAPNAGEERETSPTEARKAPGIPDRPKPQVPARPSKNIQREAPENESKGGPSPPKSKPAVPARPGGGKIAGLRANFLSDLNSRLQLGPQAAKPVEKEEEETPAEKAPLSDARKGRARGPARRKPAPAVTEHKLPSIPEIKIMDAWNVWEVDMSGHLVVGAVAKATTTDTPQAAPTDTQAPTDTGEAPKDTQAPRDTQASTASDYSEGKMAPSIAKNVAGESVDPSRTEKPKEPSDETVAKSEPAVEEEQPSIVPDDTKSSETQDPAVAEANPAIEPPDEVEDEVAEAKTEKAGSTDLPKTLSEEQLEAMAASADGKLPSDGEMHAAGATEA